MTAAVRAVESVNENPMMMLPDCQHAPNVTSGSMDKLLVHDQPTAPAPAHPLKIAVISNYDFQYINDVPSKSTSQMSHPEPSLHSPLDATQLSSDSDSEIKESNIATDAAIEESVEILEEWQLLKRTVLEGKKVKLVPYTAAHVPTYNSWLNDPYIQQMTQTEPYSLSQEYEYQNEWNEDRQKWIFIILDRTRDEAMAGDINLFIQREEGADDEEGQYGELNVMVAEEASRRKGLATETLRLAIAFAQKKLEISKFVAKIQTDNESSLRLFKKLGFSQTDYVEQFKEYTFTLELGDDGNDNDDDDDANDDGSKQ